MILSRSLRWLVAGALLGSDPLAAQSVVFLHPDRPRCQAGQTLSFRAHNRTEGAERRAWPGATWCFVRGAGFQENLHDLASAPEEGGAVALALEHAGVNLVGVELPARMEDVPAPRFSRFLRERVGLEDETPGDQDSVRVRRVESLKALVTVVGEGPVAGHSSMALSKTGQAVEIRLLADPTTVTVGADVPVRTYVEGASCASALVRARSLDHGVEVSFRTDPSGIGCFRLSRSGRWRVEFHQAVRLAEDAGADWLVRSATLTFDAPGREEDR